jgi:hypothetical protein
VNDWKPKQAQAIALLASGTTIAETAKRVHVTPRTVYVWRTDPAFRAAVRDQLSAVVEQTSAKLIGTSTAAAALLDRFVEGDADNIHPDRIAEANWILERLAYFAQAAGVMATPQHDNQSGISISQTVSARGPDLATIAAILAEHSAGSRHLLVESGYLAAPDGAADSAPDQGLHAISAEAVPDATAPELGAAGATDPQKPTNRI